MSGNGRRPSPNRSSRTPVVIAVVVVVAIAAAVIAVLATRGGDDGPAEAATDGSGLEVTENQPVTVAGSALPPLVDGAPDAAVGTAPPTLTGASFSGTPVEVAPGSGSPYLVVFLAHWCPHCQAEVPELMRWEQQGLLPDGLQVVAVSTAVSDQRPNYPPSEWLDEAGWPWPVLADDASGTAAQAYGVSGFPFLVVVDADGNVAGRASGKMPVEQVDAFVRQSLGI